MRKVLAFLFVFLLCAPLVAQEQAQQRTRYFPNKIERLIQQPAKEKVWIFILAGQSNMAGRGIVEPSDTIPNDRILTINSDNEIIIAKEPLHFYEPSLTGLDCGVSFARKLLTGLDESITVMLIPAAVGGSSTSQWLGDSLHRDVKLLSNFKERIRSVRQYGTIKGILWHQGESDSAPALISGYQERLTLLFAQFRNYVDDPSLPIIIGELGSYSDNQANWDLINQTIHRYVDSDRHAFVVDTEDLHCKEDKIHFDSPGQRLMGERMAKKFLEISTAR
jgi:hypothetical protein